MTKIMFRALLNIFLIIPIRIFAEPCDSAKCCHLAFNNENNYLDPRLGESSGEHLDRLLDLRNSLQDRNAISSLDAQLKKYYQKELAVIVTDMSGMAAMTDMLGIIHSLSSIRLMQLHVEKIVKRMGGHIVKKIADDLIIVHINPEILYEISRMIVLTANEYNASIGVGFCFGSILYIDGKEIWGESVNTASKLGEDLSKPGQILISEPAYQALLKRELNLSYCSFVPKSINNIGHWVCPALTEERTSEIAKLSINDGLS